MENRSSDKPTKYIILGDFFRLLLFLCGLLGVATVFYGFPDFTFDLKTVAIGITATALISFILYRLSKPIYLLTLMCFTAYMWNLIKTNKEDLYNQCGQVYDWFMAYAPEELIPTTPLILYCAIGLTILLFIIDMVLKYHLAGYLIVTLATLLPPLFGSQMSYLQLSLIMAYQIFFLADSTTRTRRGIIFHDDKTHTFNTIKAGILSLFLFGLAFLIAHPLADRFEDRIYNTSIKLEERMSDALGYAYADDDGVINRGSNIHSEEIIFDAGVLKEPTEPIYLISFRGGNYEGSRWFPINETELVDSISESYSLSSMEVMSLLNTMYFQWNYVGAHGVDGSVRQLNLSSKDTKYVTMRPYFGIRPETTLDERTNIYTSLCYYYEEGETLELPESADRWWHGMSTLADTYREYTEEEYTTYPARTLPGLTALVEANPLEDLDEITSFIIYTLGSHTKYTVRPGLAPFNRDIVENFLFNSGLGYCQHYASTAALMYRMYGIPARYVTGYRLDPEDFVQQPPIVNVPEFSSYYGTAEVPDSAAHAWVEIHIKGYGWVPVDVTPAASGNFYPSYPGFDADLMKEIQQAKGWVLNPEDIILPDPDNPLPVIAETAPEEAEPEEEPVETPEEEVTPEKTPQPAPTPTETPDLPEIMEEAPVPFQEEVDPIGFRTPEDLRMAWQTFGRIIIILIVMGFILGSVNVYRSVMLRKNTSLDAKGLYVKMAEMYRDCGLVLPERNDDPATPAQISDLLRDERGTPVVSLSQAEKLIAIITKATFSSAPPSSQDNEYVRDIYHEATHALYRKQGPLKRLLLRFIKVYI